jgi:hypothetical protein
LLGRELFVDGGLFVGVFGLGVAVSGAGGGDGVAGLVEVVGVEVA